MKDRIKAFRKALGLKQREIAERLGINVGTVGSWEIGRDVPGDARIYQLCKEFNVRREWLEKGEGEMFEPEAKPKTDQEALEDAALALFNRLDKTAQEAVMTVLMRLLNEAREKYKAHPSHPEPQEGRTEPILVADNREGDDFRRRERGERKKR